MRKLKWVFIALVNLTELKIICNKKHKISKEHESRPRWSRGNVLTSRSKDRGFKPGWGRWIFQVVKILSTSPPGGTLNWGFRIWDFRLVKEPQAWNIDLWAKFNRHIHVLVIFKFGGTQYILKRSQSIGQEWPPHQYNTIQRTWRFGLWCYDMMDMVAVVVMIILKMIKR